MYAATLRLADSVKKLVDSLIGCRGIKVRPVFHEVLKYTPNFYAELQTEVTRQIFHTESRMWENCSTLHPMKGRRAGILRVAMLQ